jgi:hypothetical protein
MISRSPLASSLNNLSIRLAEAGRRDEALAAITEAVAVYRRLASVNAAAYEPDLASSLNNTCQSAWRRRVVATAPSARPGRHPTSRSARVPMLDNISYDNCPANDRVLPCESIPAKARGWTDRLARISSLTGSGCAITRTSRPTSGRERLDATCLRARSCNRPGAECASRPIAMTAEEDDEPDG